MNQANKNTTQSTLLRLVGWVLLVSAGFALYAGFLSPMNRSRHDFGDRAGGAVLLAVLFGAPGAYLMYRASKASPNRDNGTSDSGQG